MVPDRVTWSGRGRTRAAGGLRALAAPAAIAAVLVTGCAAAGATPGVGPVPDDQAILERALAAWAGFPVNASPRPFILLGPDYRVTASESFEIPKGIYWSALQPPASFPGGPGEAGPYRLITASQAFSVLRSSLVGGGPAGSGTTGFVTSVKLAAASFQDDRGSHPLPAWIFTFGGISGSVAVLAVAPASLYAEPPRLSTPPGVANPGGFAVGADGRTLTVSTGGYASGTGPCEAQYRLEVAELMTAVAIAVDIQVNPMPSGTICNLVGYFVPLTTVLAEPLGNRVVVGPDAGAISATSVASA